MTLGDPSGGTFVGDLRLWDSYNGAMFIVVGIDEHHVRYVNMNSYYNKWCVQHDLVIYLTSLSHSLLRDESGTE